MYYSLYLIQANKLLRVILDTANEKDFVKSSEFAYELKELTTMLHESLVNKTKQPKPEGNSGSLGV